MLPLIIGGAMAAKGLYDGYQNNKKTAAEQKYNKAVIEFSPWTKMAPMEIKDRPGMLDSAIGGGVSGAMMGQSLGAAGFGGGAMAAPAATAAPVQAAAIPVAPGKTPWQQMAAQQSQYGNYTRA